MNIEINRLAPFRRLPWPVEDWDICKVRRVCVCCARKGRSPLSAFRAAGVRKHGRRSCCSERRCALPDVLSVLGTLVFTAGRSLQGLWTACRPAIPRCFTQASPFTCVACRLRGASRWRHHQAVGHGPDPRAVCRTAEPRSDDPKVSSRGSFLWNS